MVCIEDGWYSAYRTVRCDVVVKLLKRATL